MCSITDLLYYSAITHKLSDILVSEHLYYIFYISRHYIFKGVDFINLAGASNLASKWSEVLCSVLADVIQSFCFTRPLKNCTQHQADLPNEWEKNISPQKHLAEKKKFW